MERNYREDQCNEIEALDSIYFGEMEGRFYFTNKYLTSICVPKYCCFHFLISVIVLADEPIHKFKLGISTENYNTENDDNGLSCQLVFTYTEKYPDTAPLVEVEDSVNFEGDHEKRLLDHINETVLNILPVL